LVVFDDFLRGSGVCKKEQQRQSFQLFELDSSPIYRDDWDIDMALYLATGGNRDHRIKLSDRFVKQ